MRRLAAILLLIAALAPVLWLRTPVDEPKGKTELRYKILAPSQVDASKLGPFKLEKAWWIEERKGKYGGFSALVAKGGGRLLAVSDGGVTLEFSAPDAPARSRPVGGTVFRGVGSKYSRDVEAAASDLQTGKVWLAFEFRNMIMRLDNRGGRLVRDKEAQPPAMRDWGNNSGPESLVRLGDGGFLALREGFTGLFERRRHAAVLFAADPVEQPGAVRKFTFVGPRGYSPTDLAPLPDGRVLVLLRRIVWPFPPRFGGAIAIGDPRTIRTGREWRVHTLATWQGGVPVDNFEGMAIEPGGADRAGDPLTVWLISDDNRADLQRTVLWKLRLDPANLPARTQKGAR